MTDFLTDLPRRAAALGRTIVLPEGDDPRVLDAAARLVRERIVKPVLLGPPAPVRDALRERGLDDSELPAVLDPADRERVREHVGRYRLTREGGATTAEKAELVARDPLTQAAFMVRNGEADGLVAGCVRSTSDVLRSALRHLGRAPGVATVSSAFYMCLTPPGARTSQVLTFTDAAVVPDPTSAQLAEIAASAASARRLIVGDEPRVAFLSFSTHGSASGPQVAKVRAAYERFRVLDPDTPADGELQADAALVDVVRARKAPGSGLDAPANVLVFPDLDAGNIAYKLVQRLAGATALGPILQGFAHPANDLSRGADATDIVLVACITALMAG